MTSKPTANKRFLEKTSPQARLTERADVPNWNSPVQPPAAPHPAVARKSTVPMGSSPNLSITPDAITSKYVGHLDVVISSIPEGETVRIERFQVNNANGDIDAKAVLQGSYLVTDGQVPLYNGILNTAVVADSTGADGVIQARLDYTDPFVQHMTGEYVVRVSSPSGSFAPVSRRLTVSAAAYSQRFTGQVRAKDKALPNAYVAIVTADATGGIFSGGAIADNNGNYEIPAQPGAYALLAVSPGYVGRFGRDSIVTLGASANQTVNLTMENGTRQVSGRVHDLVNSNRGLPGVQVFGRTYNEDAFTIAYTDSNGNWTLSVTPDETWEIMVLPQAITPTGYVGLYDSLFVDPGTEAVTGLDRGLPAANRLVHGTLKDVGTQSPVQGAAVLFWNEDLEYNVRVASDANGNYMAPVTGGVWYQAVEPDTAASSGYVGSTLLTLDITSESELESNFFLAPLATNVTGTVVDENDNPLSYVSVRFVPLDSSQKAWIEAESDETGNLSEGFPEGMFRPSVDFLTSYWWAGESTPIELDDLLWDWDDIFFAAFFEEIDLEEFLTQSRAIVSELETINEDYADAALELEEILQAVESEPLSWEDGLFEFDFVLYDLAIGGSNFDLIEAEAPPFEVRAGESPTVEIRMKKPTSRLRVQLEDSFGPVWDFPLVAEAQIDGVRHRAFSYTDDDGVADFGVIDGDWTIRFDFDQTSPEFSLANNGYQPTENRAATIVGGNDKDLLVELIEFEVNALTISGIADQTILEDQSTAALTFTVDSTKFDVADLEVWVYPWDDPDLVPEDDAHIVASGSGANRTVTLTPAANSNGSTEMVLLVYDPEFNWAEETFVLNVTPVNDPPTLAAIGDMNISEDASTVTISLSGIASGPSNESGQTLSITVASDNTSVVPAPSINYESPNSTATLTFAPAANARGSAVVRVTVTDDGGTANGGANAVTRMFTVNVGPINDEPTLSVIGDETVVEGRQLALKAGGTDIDGDILAYSLDTGAPAGASIDSATGVFRWTPTEAQGPGVYPITIRAMDPGGLSAARRFTVTVDEENQGPRLAAIADQTIEPFATLMLKLDGADDDIPANDLTYALESGPRGAQVNPATGELFWTADLSGALATNEFTARVSDASSSATQMFRVMLKSATNSPPIMASVPVKVIRSGELLSIPNLAVDLDFPPQELTWSLGPDAPSGMSINAATGLIEWTPVRSGTFLITEIVTDNGDPNLSRSQSFVVQVEDRCYPEHAGFGLSVDGRVPRSALDMGRFFARIGGCPPGFRCAPGGNAMQMGGFRSFDASRGGGL